MPSRAIPLFAVLLACLGLTFGLAACGGDDESTTASVELTELSGDPQGGSEPSTSQPPASPDDDGGAAAGDGGDDDAGSGSGSGASTGGAADEEGKAIFTQSCAGCHTLADAGASGSVGPNLDDARPSAEAVAAMVRSGGGGMPSFGGTLQPEQMLNPLPTWRARPAPDAARRTRGRGRRAGTRGRAEPPRVVAGRRRPSRRPAFACRSRGIGATLGFSALAKVSGRLIPTHGGRW